MAGKARSAVGLVAPFTGAWIEMRRGNRTYHKRQVAPFTGAWIEIAPRA